MSIEFYLPSNPTVCDVFHAAAVDTWERIRFSRTTPRLKIHETTITQNLVYEMRLLQQQFPLAGFRLFESLDEKANGDDLELCIQHDNGEIYTYALQAKIIYHYENRFSFADGLYPRMKHEVGGRPQIDLLLKYSRGKGIFPLYLLYNYVQHSWRSPARRSVEDVRSLGCTIISAYWLKQHYTEAGHQLRGNIRFTELHRFAFYPPFTWPARPWEVLVCSLTRFETDDLRMIWQLPDDHPINVIKLSAIENDADWRLVAAPTYEGSEKGAQFITGSRQDDDRRKPSNSLDREQVGFRPKFRIVIERNSNLR